MSKSDYEIWNSVKLFENVTLFTYVENSPNHITKVEDTGKNTDRVIIAGRDTYPTRGDIVAAYRLLFTNKEIVRKTDLAWLAVPEKKTSAIVFRIVGELTRDESILAKGKNESLKLKPL